MRSTRSIAHGAMSEITSVPPSIGAPKSVPPRMLRGSSFGIARSPGQSLLTGAPIVTAVAPSEVCATLNSSSADVVVERTQAATANANFAKKGLATYDISSGTLSIVMHTLLLICSHCSKTASVRQHESKQPTLLPQLMAILFRMASNALAIDKPPRNLWQSGTTPFELRNDIFGNSIGV